MACNDVALVHPDLNEEDINKKKDMTERGFVVNDWIYSCGLDMISTEISVIKTVQT